MGNSLARHGRGRYYSVIRILEPSGWYIYDYDTGKVYLRPGRDELRQEVTDEDIIELIRKASFYELTTEETHYDK